MTLLFVNLTPSKNKIHSDYNKKSKKIHTDKYFDVAKFLTHLKQVIMTINADFNNDNETI